MAKMNLPDLPETINRDDMVAALRTLGLPAEHLLSLSLSSSEATVVAHLLDVDGNKRIASDGDGLQKATVTISITPK